MSDPITDLKHELLAAADRRHAQAAVADRRGRLLRRLRRNRVYLVAAALPIVAAAALFFTTPWSNTPSFLARAEAALTPHAGTVLHMKWEQTWTSTDPACTVTHGPSELWVDEAPPHTFRVLFVNDASPSPGDADPRERACASGTASEIGGSDTQATLRFVPPNTLGINQLTYRFPPDPVTELREAIRAGYAHDDGKTQLAGHIVERIRLDIDCSHPGCPREPFYWYVDPDTFYPVESDGGGAIAPPGGPIVRLHIVTRYLTFEYLPRTAANLALANIQAQHPDATRP